MRTQVPSRVFRTLAAEPLHTTPFDSQPHLTGELLELRPLNEGDFAGLFAVAADPLIWEQHPDRDRCQEPVRQRRGLVPSENLPTTRRSG